MGTIMNLTRALSFFLLSAASAFAAPIARLGDVPVDWPGTEKFSGRIEARADAASAALSNGVVALQMNGDEALFTLAGTTIRLTEIASVEIEDADGTRHRLALKRVSPYTKRNYTPPEVPVRHADALDEAGALLSASFENEEKQIRMEWEVLLRGNAPYFTQRFRFSRLKNAEAMHVVSIRLGKYLPENPAHVHTVGKVPGSPVALSENVLCGIEQPGFEPAQLEAGAVGLELPCDLQVKSTSRLELSSMIGYFPQEQQRRAFNFYIERERAAPSRHFLLYNGWYDFGLSPTEEKLSEAIGTYGNELVKKRGVRFDAFVLDDGWDEPARELWTPSPAKFPNGFRPLWKKAQSYGAGFGIWISPTGGHFGVAERLESCRKIDGISEDALAFDLDDPVYEKWFAKKCRSLILNDRVVYFKWDRISGNVSRHFLNLLNIADNLRKVRPELFINATTGTWPSPFWLNHVDTTWRGGADIAFYNTGIGDKRDQWMSYRDGELIDSVVRRAPLYPINSVMHHGIALGTHYQGAVCAEAGNDLRREIFSYFALGANLQELYVDPRMLDENPTQSKAWVLRKIQPKSNPAKAAATRKAIGKASWIAGSAVWDCLAEASAWAQRNARPLVDMHWVTGTPSNPPGAYAFAGWHRGDGVLYLRNASDKSASVEFSLKEAFELPASEPADASYALRTAYVYGNDAYTAPAEAVPAAEKIRFTLQPLEVRVLEARRLPATKE